MARAKTKYVKKGLSRNVGDGSIIFARVAWNHPWPEYAALGRAYYSGLGGSVDSGDATLEFRIAGERLLALADAEEAKEKALLAKAGFDTGTLSTEDFIARFNEFRMGAKQYKAALDRLKAAQKRTDTAARAPTASSWYGSRLASTLSQKINEFANANYNPVTGTVDYAAWDAAYNKIIDDSVRQAFEHLMTDMQAKEGNELYGDKSTWAEVYKASQEIPNFNQMFGNIIKSRVDFSKIKNIFEQDSVKIRGKGERNTGVRKFIDSAKGLNLGAGKRTRSLGGSVDEAVGIALTQIGLSNMSGVITTAGTTVLMNEIMKIDSMTIYSFDKTVNVSTLIPQLLNAEMQGTTSLMDAVCKMEDFYNKYLKQLNDNFIIYTNAKSYSLSSSFKGFSGGGSRPLKEAPAIINAAGGSASMDVVKAAYQTAAGAFRAGDSGPTESLKAGLMGAIAHLLFDDWNTIGGDIGGITGSGATAIHALHLDGIDIPLSAFLRGTGEAMIQAGAEMKRWVKVEISVPAADTSTRTASDIQGMYNHWDSQFSDIENGAKFTYHFMLNFKSYIKKLI